MGRKVFKQDLTESDEVIQDIQDWRNLRLGIDPCAETPQDKAADAAEAAAKKAAETKTAALAAEAA